MQGQISQIHDNTSSLDTFSIYSTIHVHGVILAGNACVLLVGGAMYVLVDVAIGLMAGLAKA